MALNGALGKKGAKAKKTHVTATVSADRRSTRMNPPVRRLRAECPMSDSCSNALVCSVNVSAIVNRSHFAGDIQNAVTAIAFAKHQQCDIAVKINQRTILLSDRIPAMLEQEFVAGADFVTPGQYPESGYIVYFAL